MSILDFTTAAKPFQRFDLCKDDRPKAQIVDISTKKPNASMNMFDETGVWIGEIIIDADDPVGIRCGKANKIRCRIERVIDHRWRKLESGGTKAEADIAYAKLWATKQRWDAKRDKAWDEIEACRNTFRHLFN